MSLREEKKRQARTAIMQAARQLIHENGFEQARMRQIATAANISYQTLYNYFPTKGSILQALLLTHFDALTADIEKVISNYSGNLLVTLDAVNQLSLAVFNAEERSLWRLATIEMLQPDPDTMGMIAIFEASTQATTELLLRRAQEFGELNANAPVALIAETLFALIDYGFLRFMMDPSMQPDALLAHLNAQNSLIVTPHLRSTTN